MLEVMAENSPSIPKYIRKLEPPKPPKPTKGQRFAKTLPGLGPKGPLDLLNKEKPKDLSHLLLQPSKVEPLPESKPAAQESAPTQSRGSSEPTASEPPKSGFMKFMDSVTPGDGRTRKRRGGMEYSYIDENGNTKWGSKADVESNAERQWARLGPSGQKGWSDKAAGTAYLTPQEKAQNAAYKQGREGGMSPSNLDAPKGGAGVGVVGASGVQGARGLARPNSTNSSAYPPSASEQAGGSKKGGGFYNADGSKNKLYDSNGLEMEDKSGLSGYSTGAGTTSKSGLMDRTYVSDGTAKGSGFVDPEVAEARRRYQTEKANGGDPVFNYTKGPVGNSGYSRTYVSGKGFMDPGAAQMEIANMQKQKAAVAARKAEASNVAVLNKGSSHLLPNSLKPATSTPSVASTPTATPAATPPASLTPTSTAAVSKPPLDASHTAAFNKLQSTDFAGKAAALGAAKPVDAAAKEAAKGAYVKNRDAYFDDVKRPRLSEVPVSPGFQRAEDALNRAGNTLDKVSGDLNKGRAETVKMIDDFRGAPTTQMLLTKAQKDKVASDRDALAAMPTLRTDMGTAKPSPAAPTPPQVAITRTGGNHPRITARPLPVNMLNRK